MYAVDRKNLDHIIDVLKTSKIRPSNKKHILGFIQAADSGVLRYGKKITLARQYKYVTVLMKLDVLLGKDFKEATKEDIQKLVTSINSMEYKGQPITDATKYSYQTILKRFYKWLLGDNDEYPKLVKWIHPHMERGRNITESKLLTIEDVNAMANVADNQRDRAFVLFLYESGARIGEVMSIKIEDFKPDIYGAIVHIPEGKTGPRNIRITASSPAISIWLTQHPQRNNPRSVLFCSISHFKLGQEVVYQNYRKILLRLAERANIKKDVNPHHFRHSRATDLAKKVKSPAVLCQYMGWKQGSKEAATYVHMENTDNEILAINGIKKEGQKQEEFKPITCPRCGIKNDPASKFCSGCSLGLELQSVMDYEKVSKTALKQIEDTKTLDDLLKYMHTLEGKIRQLEKEKYER